MSQFNIYRGPVPNPLKLCATQVVLTASVYPDKRSASTGGFHILMTINHQTGSGVNFDLLPVETFETVELAEARAMHLAAERQVTDVYIETL